MLVGDSELSEKVLIFFAGWNDAAQCDRTIQNNWKKIDFICVVCCEVRMRFEVHHRGTCKKQMKNSTRRRRRQQQQHT